MNLHLPRPRPAVRHLALGGLGALIVVAVGAPIADRVRSDKPPPRIAHERCAGASASTADVLRIQKVVLCLHNTKRGERGLSKLRWNSNLSNVASKYARTMVAHRHFSHYSAGHRDQLDRIATSNYEPHSGCWTAGENLYSSDGTPTPKQIMSAWMHSPEHRQNVLHRGWHDFGLGVTTASASGNPNGVTIDALFGLRARHNCS